MFQCQKPDGQRGPVSSDALPNSLASDTFALPGGRREFSRPPATVDQDPFRRLRNGGLENGGEVVNVKEQRFRIKRTIQVNVTKRGVLAGQW